MRRGRHRSGRRSRNTRLGRCDSRVSRLGGGPRGSDLLRSVRRDDTGLRLGLVGARVQVGDQIPLDRDRGPQRGQLDRELLDAGIRLHRLGAVGRELVASRRELLAHPGEVGGQTVGHRLEANHLEAVGVALPANLGEVDLKVGIGLLQPGAPTGAFVRCAGSGHGGRVRRSHRRVRA